jgi:hypothetical protein
MGKSLWILVLSALVLLPMSAAMAKKGGNGGGGGGGSNLPAEELVFTGRWPGTNCTNCPSLYKGTANATQLTRLNTTERYGATNLSVDPAGRVAGTSHNGVGYAAVDLVSGNEVTLNTPSGFGWTHLRDSGGTLLSYDQQWVLSLHHDQGGPERPDEPGQPYYVRNVTLSAADGTGDFVHVTTYENEWDEIAEVFTYRESSVVGYVPQQPGGTPGEAWVIYRVRELMADYSNSPDNSTFEVTSETTELRVATLDVSDLAASGVLVVSDDVASSHASSESTWGADSLATLSPDGQWALVNRLGDAWLVSVDFSSGVPVVPEPTTADLLPITPPSGWDADVQVLAVNHDASLVALNLFREEGKGKNKRRVRHLFVARSGGTDLTQIDVGTDGVEFEERFGDDSFTAAAFVPPSGQ